MKPQTIVAVASMLLVESGLGADTPFARLAPAAYGDGVSSFTGADRPNPRAISNALCAQDGLSPDVRQLSDFVWQWGQFIDHDLTFTPSSSGEMVPIPVTEPGDLLAPFIPFQRSVGTGSPREQVNQVTPELDGSMIYGSDDARAAALRTFSGGLLKTSPGNLLPYNIDGIPNDSGGAPDSEAASFFVAGDVRCNEQSGLTAMHTLFVREHNRTASYLASAHPEWEDEQLYVTARALVVVTIQTITFEEYLPALLGPYAPVPDFSEGPSDPALTNSFASAFFRLGHTQVSPTLRRTRGDGTDHPEKPHHSMREIFFDPTVIAAPGEIELVLRGFSSQVQQSTDLAIIDDLRNALFGAPGSGGMDLAALNIQRGRDHGLADFNTLREALGLPRLSEVPEPLASVYPSVDEIDPWVGALSEPPLPGASVGETIARALGLQFARLASRQIPDGVTADDVELALVPFSEVIVRNTEIEALPANVFFVPSPSLEVPELACIMTGEGSKISWEAHPNMGYTVVASGSLAGWETKGFMVASHPGTLTFSSPVAGATKQFFKVKMAPLTTAPAVGNLGL